MTPPDPVESLLAQGLAELGMAVALAAPLAELSRLLARWAARMNLTGHRTPEAIARRLILDALALAEALPIGEPETLADLGSGAGFPGLPLACRWPRCRVTLVEARERRHHFQRAAVRVLGLENAVPLRGRVESVPARPQRVVVGQAMAAPEQAIAWMARWAEPGGWLVLPQAAGAAAPRLAPGLEEGGTISYRVPLGGPERSLWVARRAPAGRGVDGCDT